MKTRFCFLVIVAFLTGCTQPLSRRPVPVENDRSIVFPQFFDHPPVDVGARDELYKLDGVVLRAIMIAANDFLPPPDEKGQPCWRRWEAQQYRVIRQGDVIFVRIDDNLEYCGLNYISLDTGVEYAISTSGRILRRIFDDEPRDFPSPTTPDAGTQPLPNNSPSTSMTGPPENIPPPPLPAGRPDGGASPGGPQVPPSAPTAVPEVGGVR
jgi:hypothetical protein